MKRKWIALLPLIIMPVFILPYQILDSLLLVDIFGCGCVPSTQTNMLNIAFNANDLRTVVFFAMAVLLFLWGLRISSGFQSKAGKILYPAAVAAVNVLVALWVVKTFLWA